MAAIIDGSTYKGFWRIVSDSVAPNEYFLLPKANGIRFDSGGAAGGAITVYCKASTDIRYIMGRTSTGTAMVYDLNIQIVKL